MIEIAPDALYKNKSTDTPKSQRYARLAFCLLAASRWAAGGNTLWAERYRDEAKAHRSLLHPPKAIQRERPHDLRDAVRNWNEQALKAEEKARAAAW
jgi:hypothetical protein